MIEATAQEPERPIDADATQAEIARVLGVAERKATPLFLRAAALTILLMDDDLCRDHGMYDPCAVPRPFIAAAAQARAYTSDDNGFETCDLEVPSFVEVLKRLRH
jgi:hypothetical protein